MKKFLFAAGALSVLALPAAAADLAPVPVCVWCGWYVGLNAGGTWNSNSVSVTAAPVFANPAFLPGSIDGLNAAVAGLSGSLPTSGTGFIGGAQIGRNWQFGAWLAGFEADLQGGSIHGSASSRTSVTVAPPFAANAVQTGITATHDLDYFGTLRGRVGYIVTPNILLYATGGLAYAEVSSTTSITQQLNGPGAAGVNTPYTSSASISSTRAGWTAGGGLEWMFATHWSVRAEYLHYDLGSASYNNTLSNITAVGPTFYTVGAGSSTSFAGDIVRAGVNFKF
jgi:outer membrane immunogenic protein